MSLTLEQYFEENGEAVANGMKGETFEQWKARKERIAALFAKLDAKRESQHGVRDHR